MIRSIIMGKSGTGTASRWVEKSWMVERERRSWGILRDVKREV